MEWEKTVSWRSASFAEPNELKSTCDSTHRWMKGGAQVTDNKDRREQRPEAEHSMPTSNSRTRVQTSAGNTVMQRFVARENINHYIGILNSDILVAPEKRETIIKLLVAELDNLNHYAEQLEFAESRAAKGRDRLDRVRALSDAAEPKDRANAKLLAANVKEVTSPAVSRQ
jgi:hypothetical protein